MAGATCAGASPKPVAMLQDSAVGIIQMPCPEQRAINGVELPDYAGVPDSGTPAGPPITSSAKP